MGFLVSAILSFATAWLFVRVFYWLDWRHRAPLHLFGGVFAWGAVTGAFSTLILATVVPWNVAFRLETEAFHAPLRFVAVASLTAESCKVLGLLALLLMTRRAFERWLDGIVLAGTLAVGFAATENFFHLLLASETAGDMATLGRVFLCRSIAGAFGQPLGPICVGLGIVWAGRRRGWRLRTGIVAGAWMVAVLLHVARNSLVLWTARRNEWTTLGAGAAVDMSTWALLGGFAVWLIYREHRKIVKCLPREIEAGTLSPQIAGRAGSPLRYATARLADLLPQRGSPRRRFFLLCAELAEYWAENGRSAVRSDEASPAGSVSQADSVSEEDPSAPPPEPAGGGDTLSRLRQELAEAAARL